LTKGHAMMTNLTPAMIQEKNQDFYKSLKKFVTLQEGYRHFPYFDTRKKITIGIGRNLTDKGISDTTINQMFEEDSIFIENFLTKKYGIDFYNNLNDARKMVCFSLCFNLGTHGFDDFKKMIQALKKQDFTQASMEIINSKASKQLPERYKILADVMEKGTLENSN
jgi:lysozyme